jgi:hypothetical protein
MSESDLDSALASLRKVGVDRLDPVQFHYVEALAQRTQVQQGRVRRILDAKLELALAALAQRLELAPRHDAAHGAKQPSAELRDSLAGLTRDLAQHKPVDAHVEWTVGAPPELKSAQYFRDTWSKISAGKQVTQALEQAPRNAGPINSHRVALASLALMRDISPDYLNRFMSYADSLLRLDQSSSETKASVKDPAKAKKASGQRVRSR